MLHVNHFFYNIETVKHLLFLKKKEENKLKLACNPQANASSVFCKAMFQSFYLKCKKLRGEFAYHRHLTMNIMKILQDNRMCRITNIVLGEKFL